MRQLICSTAYGLITAPEDLLAKCVPESILFGDKLQKTHKLNWPSLLSVTLVQRSQDHSFLIGYLGSLSLPLWFSYRTPLSKAPLGRTSS